VARSACGRLATLPDLGGKKGYLRAKQSAPRFVTASGTSVRLERVAIKRTSVDKEGVAALESVVEVFSATRISRGSQRLSVITVPRLLPGA
jgi:hypothetical protein